MKILYELDIDCDQKFNANDFPSQIEVLRSGEKPLMFRPVAIQTQDLYGILKEAESLLDDTKFLLISAKLNTRAKLKEKITEYLTRFKQ